MPHYIVLARLTAQAKRDAAGSMKARDELFSEFRKKGLKIAAYMTLGPYDVVNVVDAPSEELMMQFLVAAGKQGNVETTTMPAWTPEESDRFRKS
jgi:uncharacterized protein with GYD domain